MLNANWSTSIVLNANPAPTLLSQKEIWCKLALTVDWHLHNHLDGLISITKIRWLGQILGNRSLCYSGISMYVCCIFVYGNSSWCKLGKSNSWYELLTEENIIQIYYDTIYLIKSKCLYTTRVMHVLKMVLIFSFFFSIVMHFTRFYSNLFLNTLIDYPL